MTVFRPAVDTTAITPAPPRPAGGDIVVAMVGGLIWRKGYEYALCALRAARDRGAECRLEIAGEGPDRERIEAAIGDLGLGRSVHLHGQLHPADILGLLRRSDVFLHSSLSEGISNAVLEAMATGLPVVTTDAGGMAEVVTDGVEGCLAKRRDVAGLADGLVTLAGDTARRRSMGEAARRRVETDFDLRDHAAQFASLYHRVLAAC
jgi:glycosyltransferase involved in cell wall biosynthesis